MVRTDWVWGALRYVGYFRSLLINMDTTVAPMTGVAAAEPACDGLTLQETRDIVAQRTAVQR
jgi:hypothetical protein